MIMETLCARLKSTTLALAALGGVLIVQEVKAVVLYPAAGFNPAGIQGTVDAFRGALGTLNPNVAGSVGSGRREINWDGVPDPLAAPFNLPANFFNVNSPRGAVFNTPGAGFQVSGNPAVGAPPEFGNLNPTYPSFFTTFTAPRLFTALDSNIMDVNFFVPGTSEAALTRGFGAVFTDVDLANVSSLQFFDINNASLGTFFVPAILANETLSFLGVDFGAPIISRVRITAGNAALGAGVFDGSGIDLVALDDFIYGEPIRAVSAVVPGPIAGAGLPALLALGGFVWARRRKAAVPAAA